MASIKKTSDKLKKNGGNDIIYTPKPVALKMIEMCNIKEGEKVLDPCRGGGIFYDNLPSTCIKSYCEITENKDFFDDNNKYDLIIGNPPYSIWNKWLEHTMKLTNKFCYIMNIWNLTDTRLNDIINKGYGITKIHLLKIDWWFGHQYLILFEKDAQSIITVEPKRIYCDICNTNCKRGSKNGINNCNKKKQNININ